MIATAVRRIGINPTHPLNRGLVSHFICQPGEMGGARLRNQVAPHRHARFVTNTTRPSWWSSFGRSGGAGSIKFSPSGTTGGYLDQDFTGVSGYPLTLAAWCYGGGASDVYHRTILCVASDSANRGWCTIRARTASSTSMRFGISADNNDLSGGTATDDSATSYTQAWHHVVGVFESATSRRLYVDGTLLATSTTSVTFNTAIATGSTWLGALNVRGTLLGNTAFNGYADDWRVWNRGLSATEVWELYELTRGGSHRTLSLSVPWLRFLGTSSGASTVDGAMSDGAKPGETFSAAVQAAGSTSDGGKAGDSLAGTAAASGTIFDGAKPGDAIVGTARASVATSDGAKSGDTIAGAARVNVAMSDGSRTGDAWSQIVTINLSWSEGSRSGDALTRSAVGLGIVSDAAVSSDAVSAVATAAAAVSEGATGGDAWGGGAITVSAWSEGAVASDVWVGALSTEDLVTIVGLGCIALNGLLETVVLDFRLDVLAFDQRMECEVEEDQMTIKVRDCPPISAGAKEHFALSYVKTLRDGESLTGTPTITEATDTLVLTNKVVSSTVLEIAKKNVAAGKAVQCTIDAEDGVAGTTYTLHIVVETTLGRRFAHEVPIACV